MTEDQAIAWLSGQATTAPEGRVQLQRTAHVAELWLDHDAARNAMTTQMMGQLAGHVAALEHKPPRVWLLRARGRAFCAGGHLGDVRASLHTSQAGRTMAVAMASVLRRLEALPSVGIVVVHGAAVGGGAELTILGDVCVVQRGVTVHFAQAERGVACGWGGLGRLVQRVGQRRAVDLLLLRPTATAQRLEQLGLAIAADDAAQTAETLCERVLHLDPRVVRATLDAARGMVREADAFASVWGSDGHHEQLRSLPWGRR